jgi:hypothetical protein
MCWQAVKGRARKTVKAAVVNLHIKLVDGEHVDAGGKLQGES